MVKINEFDLTPEELEEERRSRVFNVYKGGYEDKPSPFYYANRKCVVFLGANKPISYKMIEERLARESFCKDIVRNQKANERFSETIKRMNQSGI